MDDYSMEDMACSYFYSRSVYLVSYKPPLSIFIRLKLVLSWGVAAMCSGAVHNMAELIVTRCFLGAFEAAFGAGAPYYLSLFYHRRELGLRVSVLLSTSPLANCFASALAYGITQIRNSLSPWRLLFIIGQFFFIYSSSWKFDY
jgi:MFS family permease